MIKRIGLLMFILLSSLSFILVACSEKSQEAPTDELIIKTTLYPLEYVTEQIGGKTVTVDTVYPPGVDAHTYEPTSKEITNIATADAFVYLGAGMEGFAQTAASAMNSQDIKLIEIGKNEDLFTNGGDVDHDGNDTIDPHIWLDPMRMIEIGDLIVEELTKLKPELEIDFNQNFKAFKNNMKELDEVFKTTIEGKEQKDILVSHAAYGYWERRYGISQLSISGLSTSDEPSQKQLATITRLAKEQKIKYVIFGQNDSNRTAEILQEHIGAQKLHLHNLEVLTEEDLEKKSDYISIMEENLDVLDQATD